MKFVLVFYILIIMLTLFFKNIFTVFSLRLGQNGQLISGSFWAKIVDLLKNNLFVDHMSFLGPHTIVFVILVQSFLTEMKNLNIFF